MEEKTCGRCGHFHQHYAKWKNENYHEVDWGHCGMPRMKARNPWHKACDYWKPEQKS